MNKKYIPRIACFFVLIFVSVVSLFAPSGVARAGSNLVLNPSFEAQGNSVGDAANWLEGTNHTRASDKFNTGGWSLHSTYRGAGTSTRTESPIVVSPNTIYTYSGYIWRTNATGASCMDMADLVGERQLCTKTTGRWQFLTGTWNSGSNTSVTLRLITDGLPTGDIWFDDISLADNTTVTNTPISPTNTPTNPPTPIITNTPSTDINLVLNPSFETQGTSGGDAANWTEGTNHTRASDKFHTGSWSLHSTYRGAGTDTRTTAPIAVSPNMTYTYSGYVWRTNATGASCMDMADIVGERQLCATATGSWQYLSGTWNSGSNTSVMLRLITDGSPTADIWFDDISLKGPGGPTVTPVTNTPVPPTNTLTATSTPVVTNTPPVDINLVLNPSFETQGNSAADAANWTEGTNHARASDKFNTGGWSLHSTFRGAGTSTHTTAPIPVSLNTNYTYSGYVWRTNATGGACMDMSDIAGESQLCTSAAGSWQYLRMTWNSGPNRSVTLRLITDGSPTGDIWFDDISLAADGPTPTPAPTNTPDPNGDPIIAAAGDIGCDPNAPAFNGGYGTAGECRQMQVSDLLVYADPPLTAVLTLGDNSNADGSLYVYEQSYGPTWGRVKSITRPGVGNHDYENAPGAPGYFTYFGAAAGDPTKGYYSFDVGTWHIIALNSNCSQISGGCGAGSPQEQWLKADLAAHPNMCTLAYWHHPRFSSGGQGSTVAMDPFWRALYAAGVEVVLNGHDHIYERFAPQNPGGVTDPMGIQEFIVGTGGKVMNSFATTQPNSLVRHTFTFGVLKLTLHPTSYDWQFVPEAGQTWTDTGSRNCFNAP
jgi:muramidase (phage lysozyme)